MSRAPALSPEQRRAALIAATVPLLREHGRTLTTRQIAQAAQVAEGTIFRAFSSKDELVEAAITAAFEPGQIVHRLRAISPQLPLRERMIAMATTMQERFLEVFDLLRALQTIYPPDCREDPGDKEAWRAQYQEIVIELLQPDADQLAIPVAELAHLFRLLTFAGSHAEIAENSVLTPTQIVDALLEGARKRD